MPHTRLALALGRISSEVVTKILGLDSPRTRAVLREHEADLVEVAATERFDRFCRHVERWRLEHDPDGPEPDRREQRRVHLSETYEGTWALDGLLDPVSGTIVATELERLEHRLFTQDWADARHRLEREPSVDDLARTPAQRRADALVEMAQRSAAAPEGARRPDPLVTIVVGADRFAGMCRLLDGTVLTDAEAAAVLADSVIERMTEECTHPICDTPASRCEVDHIVPHEAGGPTSIDNGRLHCGPHNRARNHPPPPSRTAPAGAAGHVSVEPV